MSLRWEMCRDTYSVCGHHEHRRAKHPLPGVGNDGNPLTIEGRTWGPIMKLLRRLHNAIDAFKENP